jgi:hypothetical protein
MLWAQPARTLIASSTIGMAGFWSAVYAAQNAVLWLGVSDPRRWDISCTEAAMDLAEALSDLEWVSPWLAAGEGVDLGPVTPLDDFDSCVRQTAGLLRATVELAARMLASPEVELDIPELLAVSRAVHLVSDAHVRLTGSLM